jgi:hypothetical protein
MNFTRIGMPDLATMRFFRYPAREGGFVESTRSMRGVIYLAIALAIAVARMLWPVLLDRRHWFPHRKTKKTSPPDVHERIATCRWKARNSASLAKSRSFRGDHRRAPSRGAHRNQRIVCQTSLPDLFVAISSRQARQYSSGLSPVTEGGKQNPFDPVEVALHSFQRLSNAARCSSIEFLEHRSTEPKRSIDREPPQRQRWHRLPDAFR